ncbi:hypothetical protein ACIBJC_36355 [Streptomyces sp. NPDC050509]|uniref:hypothetical protein n=1 Tax=Streptomyces sp. NPDC050509 TaxID=3365620 RepID=UPI0037BC39FC
MTDISFVPTFKHLAWVDNRDRVAAGGQNGFNVRFDAIQKDLEKLSTVVGDIDTSIKTAGQHPAVPRLLSLAPAFVALPPSTAWSLNRYGVAVRHATSDSDVTGLLNVAPPDGARLVNFRATGQNSGAGSLAITLFRSPLTGTSSREPLAQITATGTFGDPVGITPGKDKVEMTAFRYFVTATLTGAVDGDSIDITSVQLTYIAD